MTPAHLNSAILDHNQANLKKLSWAIGASQNEFKLVIVRCNYSNLQGLLLEQLQAVYPNLQLFHLQPNDKALYTRLLQQLGENQPEAVCVLSLETVENLNLLLASLNQVREELRQNLHFPLVVWVKDRDLLHIKQHATDLESWATKLQFNLPPEVLRRSLQQGANKLFAAALATDFDQVTAILDSVEEMGQIQRGEVEAALQDLRGQGHPLGPVLEANLQFAQGLLALGELALDHPTETVFEANRSALAYFQSSFEFWQGQSSSPLRPKEAISPEDIPCPSVLRAGVLSVYIGRCYYYIADDGDANQDTKLARQYMEQAEFIFRQANRLDLVAYCLPLLGRTIRRIAVEQLDGSAQGQTWQELEQLAQRGIELHKTIHYPWGLVQHYGFLVDAALTHHHWNSAKESANLALQEIPSVPAEQQWVRSLFLLLLARAERGLGLLEAAIELLKQAQDFGVQAHPKIYIKILNTLQELYFELGESSPQNQAYFLEAFRTKLERLSIEQQYGFRAFVGPGKIQPEQQNCTISYLKSPLEKPGQVATEMRVSRQQETEELMQRIRQPAYKLVIVHGLSGVGKSSIIDAALLPTLKHSTSGIQEYLPILIRRYDNWAYNLAYQLNHILMSKDIDPIPNLLRELEAQNAKVVAGETPHPLPSNKLVQTVLQQLQELDQKNDLYHFQVILIFDQLEEIFVLELGSDAQRNLKQQFFSFLGDCLDLTYLKVILSLREDYLHFLLEGSRLAALIRQADEKKHEVRVLSANIMGDILSQDKLYFIGNFSLEGAKNVVKHLTARTGSQLPDDLTARLVDDLAVETGEVRPIELQVMGFVLQERNILTLTEYEALGSNPKGILVGDFLDQVIKDCGSRNEDVTKLVLYLLTGEQEIRPRKTFNELTQNPTLKALHLDENRLKLILDILVESRLVLLLPEIPEDRYQLVHDYLATLIRSKVDPVQIEVRRKEQEINLLKRNRRRLTRTVIATSIMGVLASVLGGLALREAQKAIVSNVQAAVTQSQFYQESGDQMEAILLSHNINRKLQQNPFLKYFIPDEEKLLADGQLLQVFQGLQETDTLNAHQSSVLDIDVRSDGLIATAGADKTIRLWNAGNSIDILPGHNSRVNSISFGPLGCGRGILASASDDGHILVWDLSTGKILKTEKIDDFRSVKSVKSVKISPDGQWMVAGNDYGEVRFWALKCHPNVESDPTTPEVASITISLEPLGENNNSAQANQKSIRDIEFHPDSNLVAISSLDNTMGFWDPSRGKLLKEEKDCDDPLDSKNPISTCKRGKFSHLSFNFDGTILAAGGTTNRVYLWKWNGEAYERYSNSNPLEQDGRVEDLAFSTEEKTNFLAVAVNPNLMRIWNINPDPKNPSIQLQKINIRNIRTVKFDHKNRLLSGLNNGVLKAWQVTPNLEDKAYVIPDFKAQDFSLSSRGRIVAAIGKTELVLSRNNNPENAMVSPEQATLKAWILAKNLSSSEEIEEIAQVPVPQAARDIVISPNTSRRNGTIAFLVDEYTTDGTISQVFCWDWESSREAQKPQLCTRQKFGQINYIEFSPDSRYIALVEPTDNTDCSPDPIPENRLPAPANLPPLLPNLPPLLPSDSEVKQGKLEIGRIHLLSVGTGTKTVVERDISVEEKCIVDSLDSSSYPKIRDNISGIKFHPNSDYLAIALGKNVKLYSLSENKFIDKLTGINLVGHTEAIKDLDFSSDGQYLATASEDNTSRALEFQSLLRRMKEQRGQREEIASTILRHGNRVEKVTFGKSHSNFFSIDNQGIISLWSLRNITHPLIKFSIPNFYLDLPNDPEKTIRSTVFSKHERLFAFIGKDNQIFIWKIDPKDIQKRSCDWYTNNKVFATDANAADVDPIRYQRYGEPKTRKSSPEQTPARPYETNNRQWQSFETICDSP